MAGARRSGHPAANALAWPALGLLFICLMLSYSRGALLALVLGLALWFAVVPLRLRGVLPLLVAGGRVGARVAWAFARDALTTDDDPARRALDAGHELGALLVLMAVLLLAAGLAVNFLAAQRPPAPRTRRLAGRALLGGARAASRSRCWSRVAAAPGGIDGQVSDGVGQAHRPGRRRRRPTRPTG